MKKLKIISFSVAAFFAVIAIAVFVAWNMQRSMDKQINDDISALYTNSRYSQPVLAEGVDVMEQQVSCGYASIELFARWSGAAVTEQKLFSDSGEKVTTSTAGGMEKAMNRYLSGYKAGMHENLKNTELIQRIYDSLSGGVPVVAAFAAKDAATGEPTLHYSLVTGLDIPGDRVTVSNTYGYEETYTVAEFLKATRLESDEKMPFLVEMGVLFGIFRKNTIFVSVPFSAQ